LTLERAIRVIDRISDWSGRIVGWLILPLIGAMTYEVVVRHVYEPTQWAYDTSYMLYGAMFMLGAAYTLFRGAHIRTDFLYQKWPARVQAAVDAFCYLFLFFPGIAVFLWLSAEYAWASWLTAERTVGSSWMPIIYPLKTVMPVAAALLLLQGVAEFLKCVYVLRHGRWLVVHKPIEELVRHEP
jgi:TRAP-type mannitol/chloroaromatic compound transport system permease small subunit